MKILEPQYGKYFVGRGYEIEELKRKIRVNGVVVVTGDRGIGKTNLIKIIKQFFEKEKDCHYIEYGSKFSDETNRIFLPRRILTSLSIATPVGGGGTSWTHREPLILEYMEKSKEDIIIFVENAHDLKKEDIETVFLAVQRNSLLRFVLEIATPYLPGLKLRINSDQIVDLKELRDDDIKKIVKKECTVLFKA